MDAADLGEGLLMIHRGSFNVPTTDLSANEGSITVTGTKKNQRRTRKD